MTDHERAAIKAAIEALRPTVKAWSDDMRAMWKAARKYEPPAVCGAFGPRNAVACSLACNHDGDHRTDVQFDGSYIGWPRT